ncbi:MAG TPA: FlgD immunoglobulin-like domain containing protein [Candidatus Cloacimonadota bacterium]|nr:FlgD immunoglobulin-like domain containing protein [Candidatus Cloacimonadota bacterium]
MNKIIFLLFISLLLSSCIFENDSQEDFSVELTIRDQNGNLVDDLNVSFINKAVFDALWYGKNRNCVTILFSLAQNMRTSIEIRDIENTLIKTLCNDMITRGYHSIVWNGKNENDENMKTGLYFYEMKTYNDAGDIVYSDKKLMYLIWAVMPHVLIQDGKGHYYDKKTFMNFYSLDKLQIVTEQNTMLDIVDFSDTTYVFMEKGDFHCIEGFVARDKKNVLNLTWIPEGWKQNQSVSNPKVTGNDDRPVVIETELRDCYPNPF